MNSKEMAEGIINVAVGFLKEKRGMAAYVKLIHGVLINKKLTSEDKIEFLVPRLDKMIEEGLFDPREVEDKFLDMFDEQPSGTEFIDYVKRECS